MFVKTIDNRTFVWYNLLTNEQMFANEVNKMTAVNNINYFRTNVYNSGRSNSTAALIARAIGADGNSFSAVLRRLAELKQTKTPTVVEISGFENDYLRRKADVDRLFAFLADFSKRYRLVRFTVIIGSMRYVL